MCSTAWTEFPHVLMSILEVPYYAHSGLAAALCLISNLFNLQYIFTLSFLVCSVRCLHKPQMSCVTVLQSGGTLFYSIMCDGVIKVSEM